MPEPSAESPIRSIAIVGAAGACGRQLCVQLLHNRVIDADARLQLVAHAGGASASAVHGLRSDLVDAFADFAPRIELVDEVEAIDTDVVVMLAGMTVPTDPTKSLDRRVLAAHNHALFAEYADGLARRVEPPVVVVQSNPVELGVKVFADALGRHRVLGAGAYSDTLRFRREVAESFGVSRARVRAPMLGQHGDHLVPQWSAVAIDGIDDEVVSEWIATQRRGRTLAVLPAEIVELRGRMMRLVSEGAVAEAFTAIADEPADLRAAVKPFLVHCTTGHTTEIITAHAVEELVVAIAFPDDAPRAAQVVLDGELGLSGVIGMPVRITHEGWTQVVDPVLAPDELDALRAATAVIDEMVASVC